MTPALSILSGTLKEVIATEVDKMLKTGVIVPSKSEWMSLPVLVKKKDG